MVIIDPYRGGQDTGYTSNNIIEKNYNLEISNYIKNRLLELGIDAILTREGDIYLTDEERANIINKYPNSIAISNRLNYGDENGVEILYSLKNSNALSNKIKDSFENNNIYVNKIYQKRDENETSLDNDNLLKNTNRETIIINYGYINNSTDSYNLKNSIINYGESVVRGIANYLNVPYTYNNEKEYIVKKGDTLYSIAKKFNLSVDYLKRINNLTSNTINIGQILKLSPETSNETIYIVKKGDSLWSISNQFNITVSELKSYNNLTSNVINVGLKLKIPVVENDNVYIVKPGDTLYSIARLYNVSVDGIKSLNNLSSNVLSVNQKLLIPSSTTNNSIYIVKRGDTLYSIAKKYNTSVFEIKKINNLDNNNLSINQKLLIPS